MIVKYIKDFIFISLIIICFYTVDQYSKTAISKVNTLCYSWIPYNKYEIRSKLCNINCSYMRKTMFPLNTPFRCKNDKKYLSANIYCNNSYTLHVTNTSSYGIFMKNYNFFYSFTNVYTFL